MTQRALAGAASEIGGLRAVIAVVPPLGGVDPALAGQHPDPAEAELPDDVLDRRVVGEQVAGDQPVVVRRGSA